MLKIATYNIHRCIGLDKKISQSRIVSVLQEIDADIVALQEVASHYSFPADFLHRVTASLGYTAISGFTLMDRESRYGNVILTRTAPESFHRYHLSIPHREPRGLIEVTMKGRHTSLTLFATHLGLSTKERRQQVQKLSVKLNSTDSDIVVLMGDFNEWLPWSRSLQRLKNMFTQNFHPPTPATFPAHMPLMKLDRIWVRPASRIQKIWRHQTNLSKLASDHLPLIATLDD
ncbi:endonuclease/exonuclease/phosphatase family protein [Desulfogranum japonicum]|uniref:endonuclease/exonuclease/phosphatase family protein n=1 Tax=Desulfogranum japonicum TaxID=231447 RepID=UPI0004015640|nr:endonuclease/exonuclease/phosphatase family protein [Desulfogranum japonicum]